MAVPAAILKDNGFLSGDFARGAEYLGVTVAEGSGAMHGAPVVTPSITERAVSLVANTAVELDPGVELDVLDVDPDHLVSNYSSLLAGTFW